MQTITFYAYKGGTGRTLALANAARYLSRLGQRVFALDLDLEAPGLHYKLDLVPGGPLPPIERGVVDCIYSFHKDRQIPESITPYTTPVPREEKRDGPITLMPAGDVRAATYWRRLAQLNWHDLFYQDGTGVAFFLEMKERIRTEFAPDFLLIDARTGITEVGGVATTVLPDQVVCLLLNNKENLEGARDVLRSVKRVSTERGKTIGIVPVISRLPRAAAQSPVDAAREQRLAEEVRSFLCEPADDPAATLDLPAVSALHAEESLAYEEALRIGGNKTVDESPLLRDYLRLFAQIIPSERVEPHLDRLINAAMGDLLEKPDRVQADLEALATYCPHPTSFLALLKFYRLRNAPSATILRTAVRFWEVSRRADHPLLQSVVREHYHPERPLRREMIPSEGAFAQDVWEAAGSQDPDVGLRIVDQALRFKRKDKALEVIQKVVAKASERPEVVVECIKRLISAEEYTEAENLIRKWSVTLAESLEFQSAWASLVVGMSDPTAARRLFESKEFRPASILSKSPHAYIRLLKLAGRKDELEAALQSDLDRSLTSQDLEQLHATGMLFMELGQFDQFRSRVERLNPRHPARSVLEGLSRYGRTYRRRRPDDEIEF
jgi:hypothetical protein